MRRFLPISVLALLVALVATPVQAGYLIIRVLFEGTDAPALDDGTGGIGMPGRPGMPGRGPGYGSSLGPMPGGGQYPPGVPGPGGMGEPGNTGTPQAASNLDPTRSIVVVIPVTNELTEMAPFDPRRPIHPDTNPRWKPFLRLTHRGQQIRTHLFADSSTVQWYENLLQTPRYRRTHDQLLQEKHDQWTKNKSDTKLLYDTILAALQHGYVDLAVTWADELVTAVGDKTDAQAAEVARFVKAYKPMQSGIKNSPAKPGNAKYWEARLNARNVLNYGHYSIVYWDTPPEEVQRRAALLEENFRAFYLVHAIRGVELPLPETPLVAVLAKQAVDVLPLTAALDASTALRADGSYAPEHDLLILSPERLDGIGQTFLRQVQQIYRDGVSRELLLKGQGPKIHAQGQNGGKKPDEVAWMQTMALVEQFMDENAALYAISREGSRQLLHRTGQLAPHVQLPNWLSSGLTNTFARPRDPAFIKGEKDKWFVAVATTTGYGGPNYVLQRYLRDLEEKKELHPDSAQLLKNVLNDAYFAGLRDPQEANDPDPRKDDTSGIALNSGGRGGSPQPGGMGGGLLPPPVGGGGQLQPPGGGPLGPPPVPGGEFGMGDPTLGPPQPAQEHPAVKLRKSRERLLIKAEATAWALCYYLSRERPTEFRKFLDELSLMPRDLPLDGAVVSATFFKAFNLDGRPESLRAFADAWLSHMRQTTRVSQDVELIAPKPSKSTPGGIPGSPLPPGGGS